MSGRASSFFAKGVASKHEIGMNDMIGRDGNGKEMTAMDFLERDKMFRKLKKGQLKKLAKCFSVLKYNKGDIVVRKGDASDALYIIAYGIVEFSDERDGEKVVLRKFAAGEMFGEFGMVNGSPRTLTALAFSDHLGLLMLTKENYDKNLGKVYMEGIEARVNKINKTMISGGLTQIDFLKDVPPARIVEIGNLFKYEYYNAGHTLFREGDKGDRFYLVYSGALVLTIIDDLGFPMEIARLKAGSTFGETSLLQDTQRSATATTLETTELFSLGRYQFTQFRYFVPEINDQLTARLNQSQVSSLVPIFQSLSIKQKMNLNSIAEKRDFKPGQVIFQEGDSKHQGLYIITSGSVDVLVNKDGVMERIRTLGEGSYFGEVSLVSTTSHGHTATIQATKFGCTCMRIGKRDFRNLLRESPSVATEMEIKVLGDQVGLEQLLRHPLGKASFLEHCESEYATENVEFFQEVTELEELGERKVAKSVLVALKVDIEAIRQRKQDMLEEKARDIVKKFVLPSAPSEINIPADMRQEVIDRVKTSKFSYDMFAEAKEEVFRLIQADNFTRYKKSPQFKEVLDKIGQYNK